MKDNVTPSKLIPNMSRFKITSARGMASNFYPLNVAYGDFKKTLQVACFELQRRSRARIIALTLPIAAIPYMCGLNTVYICGCNLGMCSLQCVSMDRQGALKKIVRI